MIIDCVRITQLGREYSTKRSAFGKLLRDHPLHVQTLSRMEVIPDLRYRTVPTASGVYTATSAMVASKVIPSRWRYGWS